MITPFRLLALLQIFLFASALWITGCGGSNIENPVTDAGPDDDSLTSRDFGNPQSLNVKVNVSQAVVQPGEIVQLTATVDGVQGFRILLDWVNVTEHGTLSITSPNSATWIAPEISSTDGVQLEVIQFVVTVFDRVVSVKESGIDTDTMVSTETKTVLLTVAAT
ncbi:MAG: hypothetical protein OXN17_02125 [Candidatus Poribacteria bacterium]|nr:hypothetical protein [Candidatus Poribacteria bacterium]MDE0503233.1 hypothetical protein [Candidatus Poribacteria bacterium]